MGETKPCRCCLAQGLHKDLNSTYSWLDQNENYANMLQDCFNIVLSTSLQNGNGICDECVKALRGARSFKQKVVLSEQELMRNMFIEIDMKPAALKLEPKLDSDGAHSDDCSLADAVRKVQLSRVKVESPPAAVSDDTGLQKRSSRRGFRRPAAAGDCSSDVSRLLTRLNSIQNSKALQYLRYYGQCYDTGLQKRSSRRGFRRPAAAGDCSSDVSRLLTRLNSIQNSKALQYLRYYGQCYDTGLQKRSSRRGFRRPAAAGDCSSDVSRLLTRLNSIQNSKALQYLRYYGQCYDTGLQKRSSRRGFRRPAAAGDCSSDVSRLLTRLNSIQNNGLTIKRKKVSKVANTAQCVANFATNRESNNMQKSKAKSQGSAQKLQTVGPIKVLNRETQPHQSCVQNNSINIKTATLQSSPKKTDSATEKSQIFIDKSMIDKHRSNIREVLLCSNGTLIRRGGLSYSCYFCTKHFPNPQKLKQHSLADHDDTHHKTINFSELRRIITHLDITSLQCKLCYKDIERIEELLAHLKNDHKKEVHLDINNHIVPYKFDGDKLKCVVCGNEYFAFKKLQEHMNSHYNNYVCQYCSAGFVNFGRLYSHLTRHEQEGLAQKFKCSLCPKTFTTQVRLKYHNRIHEGLNIKCAFCGESFKDYKTRFKHLSEIHGVRFQTYDCHACDKSYNTASSLTIHIKRHHLVERNFACKQCDLKFFSRQGLEVHMVTHTGAKDFQCEICPKKFGRKKTLKEHLRIHLNDRRFECFHCGQSFVQKVSLRYHLRSKHSDKLKC